MRCTMGVCSSREAPPQATARRRSCRASRSSTPPPTSGLPPPRSLSRSLSSPPTCGNGSALVTFAPPTDDGGAPITAYTITASTGQTTTTPDARTFATVSGLTNGTAVTFTVRAVNAEGTGPASAASNSVTPTGSTLATAPDTAPTLRFFGLPTHLALGQFLKELHFAVKPSKPSSLQIMLRGTVNRAAIADAFDLTLAHKTLGISAAKRTIALRPSRNLVGDPSRVKVQLVIVAYDAAGSRSTTTRTITVRR